MHFTQFKRPTFETSLQLAYIYIYSFHFGLDDLHFGSRPFLAGLHFDIHLFLTGLCPFLTGIYPLDGASALASISAFIFS
jgi:hypothetical protein